MRAVTHGQIISEGVKRTLSWASIHRIEAKGIEAEGNAPNNRSRFAETRRRQQRSEENDTGEKGDSCQ